MDTTRLLLLLLTCLMASQASAQTCQKKISACQCQTASGKYIDLMPLAKRDDYRFKKISGPGSWVYSYNPCFGFKCQGVDNVAICQNDIGGSQEFALGTQDTAEFGNTLGGMHLTYTSIDGATTRKSVVSLVCSQSGVDEFQPTGDGTPGTEITYTSTLTSKHACEVDSIPDSGGGGGGGMSGGDVLLIIFFVGIIVYLAGGFAVNALVLKRGVGPGAVPNLDFWLSVPGYIRDGVAFTVDFVRQLCPGRREGYEKA